MDDIKSQQDSLKRFNAYFKERNMQPLDFQIDALKAWEQNESVLIIAPTGFGKTLAAITPALLSLPSDSSGLTILWITPLRALAVDTTSAIQQAINKLQPKWRVESRTGDTKSSQKAKQDKRMPQVLITTTESLSLMLSRKDVEERFEKLSLIVVDEWHALLETKRGIQTELCLARLRKLCPALKLWGLSATLANPERALNVLLGDSKNAKTIIQGPPAKDITLETVLPEKAERFPWGGHLGLKQLHAVANYIDKAESTLVFTNTRSQTELWYQALLDLKPEWAGLIALHHGSLDIESRRWVETSIRDNHLKAVICTATLDLGVDFSPVEQVIQIGSAKGVARLRQRAGRSGHRPDAVSKILLAPTHAFEIIEAVAAKKLLAKKDSILIKATSKDKEQPIFPAIDVLIQHLVTLSLGTGFKSDDLWHEIKGTCTYKHLTEDQWQWVLSFVTDGGVLHAYPEYKKLIKDEEGIYHVANATIARRHRHQIGTIVSDATLNIQWVSGGRLGHIEESFVSRLKPGSVFQFGGRKLELVRIRDMTAYVRASKSSDAPVAKWMGSTMPLSTELAETTRLVIGEANSDILHQEPEWRILQPLFHLQNKWSYIPKPDETLAEIIKTREGWHLFVYTFAGHTVNLALASLWAWRLAQRQPSTISIAISDYGLELVSPVPQPYEVALGIEKDKNNDSGYLFVEADKFSTIEEELIACVNETELSKRRFREIARIAGLIYQGYPGEGRSSKHLQTSSGLLFEIFQKHDPENLLLQQAHAEAFKQELDVPRLKETLENLRQRKCVLQRPAYPTPFSFPLYVESLRERLSNEELADRVKRLVERLERSADKPSKELSEIL